MAKELKLPELGENIESADVLNVLVKVGDKIETDQSVIEIETDKATIEVPSNFSGIITGLKIKPGDKVKPGQTILTVDESGKSAENTKESVAQEEKIPEKRKKLSQKGNKKKLLPINLPEKRK